MLTIMLNSLKEKVRNKTIYIVGIIGVLIITFLIINADFTFDSRKIVSFEELVPFAIIMVNFLASILSVMLSMNTIPNEFDRKTTHLILVRGIKPYEYMFSLTMSNIITSLISLCILSFSIIIFCLFHGEFNFILNIIGSIAIMSVNIAVLSTVTSVLSIKIPVFANGLIGIFIYFIGTFHNILDTLARTIGGAAGKILWIILRLIPNFNAVQKEAGFLGSGKPIDIYPIILQVMYLYIILSLTFFIFKREV